MTRLQGQSYLKNDCSEESPLPASMALHLLNQPEMQMRNAKSIKNVTAFLKHPRICSLHLPFSGLDKSLAVSHDTMLAAGSGEDKGDDLCGNREESVSGCRCPATSEALVGLAIIACAISSRYISAQWQSSSCWSSNSSSVHPVPLR
jgi:hypothetical protein